MFMQYCVKDFFEKLQDSTISNEHIITYSLYFFCPNKTIVGLQFLVKKIKNTEAQGAKGHMQCSFLYFPMRVKTKILTKRKLCYFYKF